MNTLYRVFNLLLSSVMIAGFLTSIPSSSRSILPMNRRFHHMDHQTTDLRNETSLYSQYGDWMKLYIYNSTNVSDTLKMN